MKKQEFTFNTLSIKLSLIIGKVYTYIDIMEEISKNPNIESNSFWGLIFNALYDLVIIESFKLIDKKNLSLFSLIKRAIELKRENKDELEKYKDTLIKDVSNDFQFLIQHRNTQKAHSTKKQNSLKLPRYANLNKILKLLEISKNIIEECCKKITGHDLNRNFNSIFTPNHNNILDYISKLK